MMNNGLTKCTEKEFLEYIEVTPNLDCDQYNEFIYFNDLSSGTIVHKALKNDGMNVFEDEFSILK